MKRIITSILTILVMVFMIGCNVEEPVIVIDEHLEVYLDEEYEVLPFVEGVSGEIILVFSSTDKDVFVIENGNTIVPVGLGSADLVITLEKYNLKQTVKVDIIDREFELSFLNESFELLKDEELALVLLANDNEVSDNISWLSSDNNIAIVDSSGVVKGLNLGSVQISAKYKEKELIAEVEVVNTKTVIANEIIVSGIKVVEVDDAIKLNAHTIYDSKLVWTSSNEDIASINNSGILIGKTPGVTTITVSLEDNPLVSLSFDVTVQTPVLNLSVNPSNILIIGDNDRSIIVRSSTGFAISRSECEFRSFDDNIIEVTEDGRLIAVGIGRTFIEAKHGHAVGLIEIVVEDAPEINYINLLLEKAIGEEGYIEGPNNDTKYGDWYGMPNQPWCAMFVSWSAYEVGIPITIIPKYASVQIGMDWFKAKGSDFFKTYEETQSGEYTPKAGDIVFFKSNGASHTGIVIKTVGDMMYTIEGNTSDAVKLRYYYYKNYNKITGYGLPKYQASSTAVKDFDITKATFGGGASTT